MDESNFSYKIPPDVAGKSYETWKREVLLWQDLTDLPKRKQAGAFGLSLPGKYRKVATNVDRNTFHCDDGVKNLLDNMDKHFKKEMLDEAYDSYLEFSNYRRNDCVQSK